jgi:WD40 repeat protein
MPPQKNPQDSKVDVHAAFTPLGAPLSFVKPDTLCSVVGNSISLWNFKDGQKETICTPCYSITRFCGNATRGLIAFSEGGTAPKVYVYSVDPPRHIFTLEDTAELELADMNFSRCGSRLYTISKATSNKMRVFSMVTGEPLDGCDLPLPSRFDRVSVYPKHKDTAALVHSSNVRIVNIKKSFQTYIATLHQPTLPSDSDLAISAYAWTPNCQLLVSTRQGLLCCIDGASGDLVHVCQTEKPITSIAITRSNLITVHNGNEMKFWIHDPEALPSGRWEEALANAPPMETPLDDDKYDREIYKLRKVADAERTLRAKGPDDKLLGQVVQLEASPDYTEAVLVTSEGETWAFEFPTDVIEVSAEQQEEEDEEQELVVETIDLDLRLLTWFHTHPITDVCFVGQHGSQLGVSIDEGGLLRIWDVTNDSELKGFRLMRFSSALTTVACDNAGTHLLVGSDMGTVRLIDVGDWKKPRLMESQRISEAGIAMIRSISREDGWQHVAALTFDNKIAFLAVIDGKLVMYGFVDVGGNVEDLSWHGGGTSPHQVEPGCAPKLLVAGSYHHLGSGEKWPCLWSIEAPPVDYEPTSLELRRDVCPISSMKRG